MTTGEPSPWGPGPSGHEPAPYASPYPDPSAAPPAGPYPPTYEGPWGPPPGGSPAWPSTSWPTLPPGAVTDEQLRRLPPPVVAGPPSAPARAVDQRPAVVALAVTLAVTASLLWVCGLSLFLLVAVAGTRAMSPIGEDGYVFHTLDEAVLRMGDGLWVPLYGFPVASIVTAFLLLARRPWTRIAHSAVGVASLAWAAWWLRESLLTWFVVAVYVGTAVGVLWVPSMQRWYAGRPQPARRSEIALEG